MNGAKICQQTTKGRHIFIVRFIQVTSIVHFQLEDFEFITKLNKQLSNFVFVKRPVESSLSVCSML